MNDSIPVTGIVLSMAPAGEYDRRVGVLTLEHGKITAFARGARHPGNRLMAATCPPSYGTFVLRPGRSAYTMTEAVIEEYFEPLRYDYVAAAYCAYFLEVADYYAVEEADCRELMKLVYQSLRALLAPKLPNPLVRATYELRAIAINGEYPGPPEDMQLSASALKALRYITSAPIEKLYTFLLSDDTLKEVQRVAGSYCREYMEWDFKSLEVLAKIA